MVKYMLAEVGMWDPQDASSYQLLLWRQDCDSELWDFFLKLWIKCPQRGHSGSLMEAECENQLLHGLRQLEKYKGWCC